MPGSLRCKEGLKHSSGGLLIHAHARVGDRDADKSAGTSIGNGLAVLRVDFHVLSLDEQVAAGGHGISGIDDQVHEHLLDLPGIGLGGPHPLSQVCGDRDSFADQPASHVGHAFDNLVEIEQIFLHGLPPAEKKKLSSQVRGAYRRPLGLF